MFAIICPLLRKTSRGIGSGEVEYTTNILGANLGAFALMIALGDSPAKLYSLIHLLPYNHSAIVPPLAQLNSYLGLVLEVNDEVIVLAVNSLLGERELVLKSFDLSLRVPAYVQGCTVLGTGEVVPVLSFEYFGEL